MRGTLLRQGLALALVSLTPLSPALAAEDLPQPREVFDCSRNPPPTLDQVAWVALAFAAAWGCTAGDPVPFPVTDLACRGPPIAHPLATLLAHRRLDALIRCAG